MPYANNPEKRREYSRKYYAEHKDKWPAYVAKYKAKDPEYHRDVYRKYHYGITREDYDAMFTAQDGRCAICRNPMPKPHVDHDHDTGIVRGILCGTCNRGLGQFQDDPDLLLAAFLYLHPDDGNPT